MILPAGVAPEARLLLAAAWLMCSTGLLLAGFSEFWPLLIVAFVGTMNPSSGDVSVFLPLEHARLAETAHGEARTFLFARYTFIGALCGAVGALATGIPDLLVNNGFTQLDAIRAMFMAYGLWLGWRSSSSTARCRIIRYMNRPRRWSPAAR